ncbi:casein kinase substrate phosphoprotein PP28-domain-containing protein [Bombardia bombarda]|uniref:Casein kinase substrate phosphoprotein PP28-domain-containing protein n=1 Tax=Bombardia bombarda TaxID=252184 RepID=A0AA39X139_9PEZI|nr:casein kinase substrate phosphoprotein PP28-domain-containing protein [Bombardia bombarda]
MCIYVDHIRRCKICRKVYAFMFSERLCLTASRGAGCTEGPFNEKDSDLDTWNRREECGKHFSRDLKPLDADGNEISMWSAGGKKKNDDLDSEEDSDDDSSEESSEEDSDEAGGPSAAAAELNREQRKQEKKAKKEKAIARAKAQSIQVGDLPPSDSEDESSEDDVKMPANPNHSKASRNQAKAPVPSANVDEAAEGVKKLSVGGNPSRRERETIEAAAAKERYMRLHDAGKTDEAKADLARLKLVREKRQAEAARKQAEKEEREAQEAARKAEIDKKEAKKREAAMGPQKAKGKPKK